MIFSIGGKGKITLDFKENKCNYIKVKVNGIVVGEFNSEICRLELIYGNKK